MNCAIYIRYGNKIIKPTFICNPQNGLPFRSTDKLKYDSTKHHRHSIRLSHYDYSKNGIYAITICTQHRAHLFGRIENGKMILNGWGKIVKQEWENTAKQRPYLSLDEFAIMPDHFHGIIIIANSGDGDAMDACAMDANAMNANNGGMDVVRALRATPLQPTMASISPKSGALPTIIRAFKSAVSNRIHKTGFIGQIWQRNYWERIIRDDAELERQQIYIANNPKNWTRK